MRLPTSPTTSRNVNTVNNHFFMQNLLAISRELPSSVLIEMDSSLIIRTEF
jgi:hypothetical protein